jgi:hypothetical protein
MRAAKRASASVNRKADFNTSSDGRATVFRSTKMTIAVVVAPIDQRTDRGKLLIFNDRGVIERAQQRSAALEFLAMTKIVSSICAFPLVARLPQALSASRTRNVSLPLCSKATRRFRVETGSRRWLERSRGIARLRSTYPKKSCGNLGCAP